MFDGDGTGEVVSAGLAEGETSEVADEEMSGAVDWSELETGETGSAALFSDGVIVGVLSEGAGATFSIGDADAFNSGCSIR